MKNKIEDILDEALSQLQKGASLEAVLFNFDEHKEALLPLLQIMQPGIKLPLKEVPKPALQRKYLSTHPQLGFFNQYLSFTKLALMPLALVIVFTASFTAEADPGQPLLYSLKRAVQKAPLALIRNPDVRAAKELELSEQNLNEAEKFLNSDHEDASKDADVVANLAKETSETVASVKDAATAGAISGKNNELLNKLVIITQKQEKLVNAVKAPEEETEASTTLEEGKNETTKTVAEVSKILATVNEQVLANLKEQTPATDKEKTVETPIKNPPAAEKPKTDKLPIRPAETEPQAEAEVVEASENKQVSGTFILEYPTE